MAAKVLLDERTLLSKVAEGDQRAFRAIYDHYYDRILGYGLRLLKSDLLAEEMVQHAFLKIWTLEEKLTEIENLERYLITVARNHALDVLRRRKLTVRVNREISMDWSESHNETEEEILLNDTRRMLDEAIELLAPQQKRVYKLCRQQGLKYDEAAKELNLSPATVQSYMKLALSTLRKHLANRTDIVAMLIIFKLF
ncbi:DNA-directed RNA polymerase sigma-70 factor [Parapedobacter defluvii]|uniref:DNA-directed RNA polymerase sigma-70 factor n=1 Tax=Parapedobacter defluvii TaxID=2045106 RepID=A0ABQ1MY68_9SPHI|nr:RNA polymerase sigma-70 factor [Parapedobacter defluvii]RQP10199.1 MAG: RNA polymerase sigma-70 factor [Parapedobacter sp.]GGC47213.1 DNA-directed RNA polymerase sigma-70 factor [Parapedobacter defluvii]